MAQAKAAMRFIRPEDVETHVFDWGMIKWHNEVRTTGATLLTAGVVILDPGKGHLRHNHPTSDEILYFISGEGEQMVEDERGDAMYEQMKAGDMAYIPTGVFHGTLNTGWEPLRILAVYAPGGPEKVLRELPGTVIVPAGEIAKR